MRIRWKLAGALVGINVILALAALVGLGASDPNWIESGKQVAEKAPQESITLAGVIPTVGR